MYQFLHFGETVPTSLYEYDSVDNPTVFSVNSFSKILAPGLRVGWIATNKKYISRLLECPSLQSGGGFNPMASAVVSQLMESDFLYKHTDFLRKNYKKTCDVLCSALEEHVVPALKDGEKLIYEKPTGGFFCFVSLPERFDTEKLLDISVKKGVTYFCGKFFSPDEKSFKNCLRLCFAFLEAEEITKGVERLAEAVRSY